MSLFLPRKILIKIFHKESTSKKQDYRQLILRKGINETPLHIVIKVLSYIYFWDKEPVIEPYFRFLRFKPDLMVWRDTRRYYECRENIDLWIECKKVKLSKLIKLGRALPNTSIIWVNKLKYSIIAQTLLKKKKKYRITPNIQLLGIKITPKSWRLLKENILAKGITWNVVKRKNDLTIISFQTEYENMIEIKYETLLSY